MSWPHRLFAGQFTDFELKLLRVFRVVVDCGGFSAADRSTRAFILPLAIETGIFIAAWGTRPSPWMMQTSKGTGCRNIRSSSMAIRPPNAI